jgi:NAD(P)-dependent dehydrogenase (short-subunit alcohol dehydrogenase family)
LVCPAWHHLCSGQTVLLLGASSSGVDIAEELATAGAKCVYLCAAGWENPLTGRAVDRDAGDVSFGGKAAGSAGGCPIVKAASLAELHADGSASLADGSRIPGVDVVMYCTGYEYDFPFLCLDDVGISVEGGRVGPLYQHVFPPAAAPTLSFVGLPFK